MMRLTAQVGSCMNETEPVRSLHACVILLYVQAVAKDVAALIMFVSEASLAVCSCHLIFVIYYVKVHI